MSNKKSIIKSDFSNILSSISEIIKPVKSLKEESNLEEKEEKEEKEEIKDKEKEEKELNNLEERKHDKENILHIIDIPEKEIFNINFVEKKVDIITKNKSIDKERYIVLDSVVPLEIILPSCELTNKSITIKSLSVSGNHKIKTISGENIDFYIETLSLSSYQVRKLVPCKERKTWFVF